MSASIAEQAFRFACQGEQLVGVLAAPALMDQDTGVLVVVGGPQYRVGSHRHFVELARLLAQAGWPVLRFDVRGMGDSTGAQHNFEQISSDIGAAADEFFRRVPSLRRIVLWGLCDGASASLLYLRHTADARVAGLVLVNPWVQSADTLVRAQVNQYYARRLLNPATWRALIGGRIGWASILDFGSALRKVMFGGRHSLESGPAGFQQLMVRAWSAFSGPTLLVLSGNDLTAREFLERSRSDPELGAILRRPDVRQHAMDAADHTLSKSQSAHEHATTMLAWLSDMQRAAMAPRPSP